ncbi:metal-dependent hydrolase, partial [Streptomyces sp. NPDC058424]|uniref:metal-dependent hydrolase n=1 Tax=Streptomyces sp. NPDC058424 TaxID=3346491 RepID=UPI0036594244
MMGHSHAVSGALLFAGTAPYVPPLVLHTHLAPQEILMGTVLCAGAALLPDLDHHDGTIANFLGPVSKVLCRFVAWISGGHRHATHSLFFVILMTVGSWAGITYLVGLGQVCIGAGMSRWQVGQAPVQTASSVCSS